MGLAGVCAPAYADIASELVKAAQSQIGVTTRYDPSYQKLTYPGGDVPQDRGVCTDVVIRAYRQLGLDLQVLVYQDIKNNGHSYPKIWGLKRADANIDHRRVPNLAHFFQRQNAALKISTHASDYQAGDIVTWMLPGNLPHIGIVSNRKKEDRPLIIHNIGQGTQEEDVLFAYKMTGHYRYAQRTNAPSK